MIAKFITLGNLLATLSNTSFAFLPILAIISLILGKFASCNPSFNAVIKSVTPFTTCVFATTIAV